MKLLVPFASFASASVFCGSLIAACGGSSSSNPPGGADSGTSHHGQRRAAAQRLVNYGGLFHDPGDRRRGLRVHADLGMHGPRDMLHHADRLFVHRRGSDVQRRRDRVREHGGLHGR